MLLELEAVGMEEDEAGCPSFAVILPLVSGAFRASLKSAGNGDDSVLLCVESGDIAVQATCVENALFVAAGSDPFQLLERSFQAVADRLQVCFHGDGSDSGTAERSHLV